MKVIVTGGAGFIGSNLAARLIKMGAEVVIVDDLSRPGVEHNLDFLEKEGPYEWIQANVCDFGAIESIIDKHRDVEIVYHLAAQVAVTTSIKNPIEDFKTNAQGAIHVLEAIRKAGIFPFVGYASTNKVYGSLSSKKVLESETRYEFAEEPKSISETHPLDPHSPYGCSKACADQYMTDYHRMYGIPTCIFRMSCIYGEHQFGFEDQGWVAWFVIAALTGKPITIYGNGKQVRDILWIDDLIDLYLRAAKSVQKSAGQILNVGGGIKNTRSVSEMIDLIKNIINKNIPIFFAEARPGDQPIYVSNIFKASELLNWRPKISAAEGTKKLVEWVSDNLSLFEDNL